MIKNILIVILMLSLVSYAHADSNGIWVDAKDIRGGVFGSDETTSSNNFYFNGRVGANAGSLYVSSTTEDSIFKIVSGPGDNSLIELSTSGGPARWVVGKTSSSEDFLIKSTRGTGNTLSGEDTRLYIQRSTGNIGIGTTTPTQKLQVMGDTNIQGTLTSQEFCINSNCKTDWSSIWSESGSNIYYNSGSVGIGTTPSSAILDVRTTGSGPYFETTSDSSYGVRGYGGYGGGYFRDTNSPDGTYGVVGFGGYSFYGNNDIITTQGDIRADQGDIQTYEGHITTNDGNIRTYDGDLYAYNPSGSYGIRAYGQFSGGYFYDTDDYTYTRISYGDYSLYGNGDIRTFGSVTASQDITTSGSLCIDSVCRDGFQVIKKPNINTGSIDDNWVNVFERRYANGGGNKNSGWQYISLQDRPILGIRMSGESDDGGLCIAQIGDFYATVGWSARATRLGNGGWSGRAYDRNSGEFPTKTFMIADLTPGIWSHKYRPYPTVSETVQGYFNNDYDHRNLETWTYNRPRGLDYATSNYLKVDQWYNDGQGGYDNYCKIDVLYGDYS